MELGYPEAGQLLGKSAAEQLPYRFIRGLVCAAVSKAWSQVLPDPVPAADFANHSSLLCGRRLPPTTRS
jgi:hypothetical protein